MSLVASNLSTAKAFNNTVELKKSRLVEISFLQSFGIILVVLGHSHPLYITFPWFYQSLFTFIYSFHMPLFMCLSGYLFIYTGGMKKGYANFLGKKTIRILLPYVVLSSLFYLPKTLLSEYSARSVNLDMVGFVRNLIYPHENVFGHFWFLPTLFFIFTISPILKYLINTSRAIFIVSTTALLLLLNIFNPFVSVGLFNIEGIAELLVYFWLGCLLAHYGNQIKDYVRTKYYLPPILAVITFISAPGVITGITGILMSFSIALIYLRSSSQLFKYIDGYSYQIYLISWPVQAVSYVLLYHKLNLGFYPTASFMLVAGLFIPVVITKVTARHLPIFKKIIGL